MPSHDYRYLSEVAQREELVAWFTKAEVRNAAFWKKGVARLKQTECMFGRSGRLARAGANEWVFSSARFVEHGDAKPGEWLNISASGRLTEPSIAHRQACVIAGVPGLTLHGLRRSFASMCEWIEVPGGISAQIQGHAPQGVREQNYIRLPIDLLRVWHDKIEAWILDQAGVKFDPQAE